MAKKRRILRHVPLLLALGGLGTAIKIAADYREQRDEIWDKSVEDARSSVPIPPELVEKMQNDGVRLAVEFKNGRYMYEIVKHRPVNLSDDITQA